MDDIKKPQAEEQSIDIGGGNAITVVQHNVLETRFFERVEYTPEAAQAITAVANSEAVQAKERTKQSTRSVVAFAISAPLIYFVHDAAWPLSLALIACFGIYAIGDVVTQVSKSKSARSDSEKSD